MPNEQKLNSGEKKYPNCGLLNPRSALECDCGYEFNIRKKDQIKNGLEINSLSSKRKNSITKADIVLRNKVRASGSVIIAFGVILMIIGIRWNNAPYILLRIGLIMISFVGIIPYGIRMILNAGQVEAAEKPQFVYKPRYGPAEVTEEPQFMYKPRYIPKLPMTFYNEVQQELHNNFDPKNKNILRIYANTIIAARLGFLGLDAISNVKNYCSIVLIPEHNNIDVFFKAFSPKKDEFIASVGKRSNTIYTLTNFRIFAKFGLTEKDIVEIPLSSIKGYERKRSNLLNYKSVFTLEDGKKIELNVDLSNFKHLFGSPPLELPSDAILNVEKLF